MAFKGLTINTPVSEAAHVYAEDHAALYKCIVGDGNVLFPYGDRFNTVVTGSNKIRVNSGLLSLQGHVGTIPVNDYQDFTLQNGTAGAVRTDLLVATFETTGVHGTDKFYLEVLTGTQEYQNGNLDNGDKKVQMPLARITMKGLAASTVEMVQKETASVTELKTQLDGIGNNVDKAIEAAIGSNSAKVVTNYGTDLWLWKIGDTVYYHHSGVFKVPGKGENKSYDFCTIPEGFIPKQTQYINVILVTNFLISGNARLRVLPTGKIDINASQTDQREYCFDGCYTLL